MKKKILYFTVGLLSTPLPLFADGVVTPPSTPGGGLTLTGLMDRVIDTINNKTIPLMVSIALLVFFWGIVRYLYAAGGTEKEESKKFLFWGVISLFVMTAIWGIVGILTNFIGIGAVLPQLPTHAPSQTSDNCRTC